MILERSPAVDLLGVFRALPRERAMVSLLLGRSGGGFVPTLAWAPSAVFRGTLEPDAALGETLKGFIDEQVARGRLVIGFLSYELGHCLNGVPLPEKPAQRTPDYHLLAYESWLELREGVLTVHAHSPEFLAEFERFRGGAPPLSRSAESMDFRLTMTREAYVERYRRIQDYIRAGDIYQINLTHQLEGHTALADRELFSFVAEANSVEHLAYLEAPPFSIQSASPERFVRIERGSIETQPIKGTRPRGERREQDLGNLAELLASEKESAELDMITDLLRNDLGRVSKAGSVRVIEHRASRPGPAVWHTLSRITGTLRDEVHPFDALTSMLPGGSISGCPKRRALEIISELELSRRGVYTGIIVRIDPDYSIDSSIAIRTLIKEGERVTLGVGGGIVYDSTEAAEFEETLSKAASFMNLPLRLS